MPTRRYCRNKTCYYQWGKHGKKYYFTPGDKRSEAAAKKKADRQGRAAYASGYRG